MTHGSWYSLGSKFYENLNQSIITESRHPFLIIYIDFEVIFHEKGVLSAPVNINLQILLTWTDRHISPQL